MLRRFLYLHADQGFRDQKVEVQLDFGVLLMSGDAALVLKLSWNGFTENVRTDVVFEGFGLE